MFINALGYYVPSERVPNEYFLEINGLTSEWIEQRTGIITRSRAAEGEDVNTMAFEAIKDALPKLPYDVEDVDLIVAASYSPLDTVATLAHVVQREFNMVNAKGVYASSACSSLANGLEIIEGYFAMNKAKRALLVCSEHNTYYSNPSDPKAGHLWGDGAVVFFVSKEPEAIDEPEIVDIFTRGLGHIGKGPGGVCLRPKEDGITMPDGRDVFMHACKYMVDALENMAANNFITVDDINYIICHQANKRIVANVAHQLKRADETFLNNIEELGNTGSASTGLVLAQNVEKGTFKKGDIAGLCVFGGGYSSGGVLIKF